MLEHRGEINQAYKDLADYYAGRSKVPSKKDNENVNPNAYNVVIKEPSKPGDYPEIMVL
jgi:hypothetical protein